MDYAEALSFIHSVSWLGSKPGLERTGELLGRLGNPEKKSGFIHIAGTNGKGSTAVMLSRVLTQAGYVTGLYTSPYLSRFNERIKIDGADIGDHELAEITELVAPHALDMQDRPTEFELVTAIALMYYAKKGCDIVVLETGMGGRLDSTNIIPPPECAVITSIGLDHTKELGETAALIAAEKAGIIKPGCDTILYQQEKDVSDVISKACEKAGVRLRTADFSRISVISDSISGQTFRYGNSPELFLPLIGGHQLKNSAVALETLGALRERGFIISDEAIARGLEKSSWPARFEVVSRQPWFIVDGGHNPQCAEAVRAGLEKYFPSCRIVFLIGILRDKNYAAITDILDPVAEAYVAVSPENPRALPASELARSLARYGKPAQSCNDISEGVAAAIKEAGPDGVVCSVGSLYMAGAVRAEFGLA